MVGGGRPLLREILGQPAPVGEKSPYAKPSRHLYTIVHSLKMTRCGTSASAVNCEGCASDPDQTSEFQ